MRGGVPRAGYAGRHPSPQRVVASLNALDRLFRHDGSAGSCAPACARARACAHAHEQDRSREVGLTVDGPRNPKNSIVEFMPLVGKADADMAADAREWVRYPWGCDWRRWADRGSWRVVIVVVIVVAVGIHRLAYSSSGPWAPYPVCARVSRTCPMAPRFGLDSRDDGKLVAAVSYAGEPTRFTTEQVGTPVVSHRVIAQRWGSV